MSAKSLLHKKSQTTGIGTWKMRCQTERKNRENTRNLKTKNCNEDPVNAHRLGIHVKSVSYSWVVGFGRKP